MARLFNGGTQPLVIQWGEGVVMPGESIEVDNPETYGPPWVEDADAEAATAALSGQGATPSIPPEPAPEGLSGPQESPQPPPEGDAEGAGDTDDPAQAHEATVRVEPNGDVVNEAGEVVGHIDQGGNA